MPSCACFTKLQETPLANTLTVWHPVFKCFESGTTNITQYSLLDCQ